MPARVHACMCYVRNPTVCVPAFSVFFPFPRRPSPCSHSQACQQSWGTVPGECYRKRQEQAVCKAGGQAWWSRQEGRKAFRHSGRQAGHNQGTSKWCVEPAAAQACLGEGAWPFSSHVCRYLLCTLGAAPTCAMASAQQRPACLPLSTPLPIQPTSRPTQPASPRTPCTASVSAPSSNCAAGGHGSAEHHSGDGPSGGPAGAQPLQAWRWQAALSGEAALPNVHRRHVRRKRACMPACVCIRASVHAWCVQAAPECGQPVSSCARCAYCACRACTAVAGTSDGQTATVCIWLLAAARSFGLRQS